MQNFFIVAVLITIALFLILLVLVQRGRGGGLAGALGGMGGQSAFGAKAGDVFTKITMWTAFVWIVFCVVSVRMLTESGIPDFQIDVNPDAPIGAEDLGAAPEGGAGTTGAGTTGAGTTGARTTGAGGSEQPAGGDESN